MKVSSSVRPSPHEPRSHADTERKHALRDALFPSFDVGSGRPEQNRGAWPVAIIAAVYLAAHIPFLAPSLEDWDSINFALGLRAFDPALHQPHPPGYPVYMVLGHASLAIAERVTSMARATAEAWSLAVWSAIGGAACLIAAWFLFAALAERLRASDLRPPTALWATLILAASPLFWMTGLRPMSDMPGLALAIGAQALMLGRGPFTLRRGPFRSALISGALLAGVAAGIRVQTATLTGPVLALAIAEQRAAGWRWLVSRPLAACAAGCLAWGIPLVIASGGINAYLAALHTQAGEDFAWVDMVWSNPTPRHIAIALYQTLVLPWASIPLALTVGVAAAIGALVMLLREWRALLVLVLAFVPYLLFHVLFQETITVRYALPVLVPIAWLAARGIALAGRFTPCIALPLVGSALIVAVPGGISYGRDPHPAFRAVADAVRRARVQPPAAVYSHYGVLRPLQAADIDPQSRHDVVRYRWNVEQRPELSGTRPLGVDWYRLQVPGWFAGRGWSLTPETGGITQATSTGPDHVPIEAWVRRVPGPFHLLVGGRHLGNAGDSDAELELAIDGQPIDRWVLTVKDRNFLRFIDLPQGISGPRAFASLTIASHSADPKRPAAVAIRQFDIQPAAQMI